jgi:hypothetical protein
VSLIRVQGRLLSEADLDQIRQLRQLHPEWSRQQLSIHLAQSWQWCNGVGRLKDMAARTLLLKLQARGLIELPAPRRRNGNSSRRAVAPATIQPELLSIEPSPLHCALESLQPVRLELVSTLEQRRRVTQLLERYHYRGYNGAVGENIQYLARDVRGRELAVMVFGAAAWKVGARDQFIGWSVAQRRTHLGLVANQQRFLILPWVRVSHLASHLLAQAVRRVSADWQGRYGHRVWLVETFVEQERFVGTAYKAAGWIEVGQTTGRTRQDRQRTIQGPIKTVWLRALDPRFREQLTAL